MTEKLVQAATALYMAGRWTLPDPDVSPIDNQDKLWEDLRDALNLEPGHSKE